MIFATRGHRGAALATVMPRERLSALQSRACRPWARTHARTGCSTGTQCSALGDHKGTRLTVQLRAVSVSRVLLLLLPLHMKLRSKTTK